MALDFGGALGGIIPSKGAVVSTGAKLMGYGLIFIIFLLLAGIAGVIIYFIIQNKKYSNTIIIFRKINGRYEQVGKDKAQEVKFDIAGNTVFLLRKHKKYLPVPEIQTGRKVFWYAIREDGEWINIGLEDIDLAMKQAKAKFLHTEMRMARTAIQRNMKDRLQEQKFMEKYGYIVVPIIVFVILGLIMYFVADKILSTQSQVTAMVASGNEMMDKASQVISGLDHICTGSGIKAG